MSFSVKVKEEISKFEFSKIELISILSAYFRNKSIVTDEEIIVETDNLNINNFIFDSLKKLYGINPKIIVRKKYNFKENYSYILKIKSKKESILKDLSMTNDLGYFINIPKDYIFDGEEERPAYIKGLFLSVGSITNPKSSNYHLEFSIDDYEYAIFVCELLDYYKLNTKILERKNTFVVYIKESEKIGDFLRVINASNAVMYFEDIRIYKDHKNMVNRLNNCEQANLEKVFNTAQTQIEDINIIEEKIGLDILDDKLKEVSIYRKKYPESSLLELSEIITLETGKKVSKSGINHRLRKIKEMASKIK